MGKRGVGVAEHNGGDVHVGSLLDGLVVSPGGGICVREQEDVHAFRASVACARINVCARMDQTGMQVLESLCKDIKSVPLLSSPSSHSTHYNPQSTTHMHTKTHPPGVRQDEQAGFLKVLLALVGECPGGVAPGRVLAVQVLRELEHGALSVGPGGLHHDVLGVLHGHDDASCHLQLLVRLLQVDDKDAIRAATVHVALHLSDGREQTSVASPLLHFNFLCHTTCSAFSRHVLLQQLRAYVQLCPARACVPGPMQACYAHLVGAVLGAQVALQGTHRCGGGC